MWNIDKCCINTRIGYSFTDNFNAIYDFSLIIICFCFRLRISIYFCFHNDNYESRITVTVSSLFTTVLSIFQLVGRDPTLGHESKFEWVTKEKHKNNRVTEKIVWKWETSRTTESIRFHWIRYVGKGCPRWAVVKDGLLMTVSHYGIIWFQIQSVT